MKRNYLSYLPAALILLALCSCVQKKNAKTASQSEDEFTFAYLTDVHLNKDNYGHGNEGLRMALDDAKNKKADFILFGGDNADTDGLKEAEGTADSLQARFKSIVDENGLPAYYTIGNHDRYYRSNGEIDTLGFNLFEKRFGPTYSSFTHKGVHFITLNSLYPSAEGHYSVDPKQLVWLEEDLNQQGQTTPVIVSIHVPMLSLYYPVVEGTFKNADMISNTKQVFDVLNKYNVKLILQGHQHIYEQIQERNRWFVTAGAVSAKWWGGPFLETKEGYLLVHVDMENNLHWEYVEYGWKVENNVKE